MKHIIGVLTILTVIGLLGWVEDIPRPSPLVGEAEARSSLPMMRLPAYLPEGTVGPVFTLHTLQGQPSVVLHYAYTLDGLSRGFQIQQASPLLRDALRPRPITEMDPRIFLGLVEKVPKDDRPMGRTIEPREEIREGYALMMVNGARCMDALCSEQEPYVQVMTCDQDLCARVEGPLETETAVQILLSLFVR